MAYLGEKEIGHMFCMRWSINDIFDIYWKYNII